MNHPLNDQGPMFVPGEGSEKVPGLHNIFGEVDIEAELHPDTSPRRREVIEATKKVTKAQRYEAERRERDAQIRKLREELAQTRADLTQARKIPNAVTRLCDEYAASGQSIPVNILRHLLRKEFGYE